MNPLQIIKYPNNLLRQKCASVERVEDKQVRLFEEMLFTMRHFAGVGLAAPQVGIAQKLIVVDVENEVVRLADPVILKAGGQDEMEEGCLSIHGVGVKIKRPYKIRVAGLDERNQSIEIKAKGLLARVLQHEIDHLQGRLIIDYAGLLEKMIFFKPKLNKGRNKYANL